MRPLPPPSTPLWTVAETCAFIRKSDSWLYALLQRQRKLGTTGLFPLPVSFGRSTYFVADEIKAWMQQLIDTARLPSNAMEN